MAELPLHHGLPSFILVLTLGRFLATIERWRHAAGILAGFGAAVIATAAFVAIVQLEVSPILLVLLGAAIGMIR